MSPSINPTSLLLLPLLLSHFTSAADMLLPLSSAGSSNPLMINITSGPVQGMINGSAPSVAQFLPIPFPEIPIGDLRSAPPVTKAPQGSDSDSSSEGGRPGAYFDATSFGPVVSAASSTVSVWVPVSGSPGAYASGLSVMSGGGGGSGGSGDGGSSMAGDGSSNGSGGSGLPVLVWTCGGGFQTDGGNIHYYLNIFGYPNAAGLDESEQNFTLLDQRLGWVNLEEAQVRSNITSFGGDPSRIALLGQSAGAVSVDVYSLAYPSDPIISDMTLDSGTVVLPQGVDNTAHSSFKFVASKLCNGTVSSPADELACMRNVFAVTITAFLGQHQDNGTSPALWGSGW
ncbi:hypothetical protein MMC25_005964 [Agyrium rufum]|nr:hypothetical protein [Agyrium rufum]